MTTLQKNLKTKLKRIKKQNPNIKDKPDISQNLPELAKEKRLENIEHRAELSEVVDKTLVSFTKADIKKLSEVTGLSVKATRDIITNKKNFKDWKKQQVRIMDTVGLVALGKLITTVNQGRVSPYQAGLMFQMLRGQIIREPKNTQPTTSISIGDNRRVNVYYPNFTQKDKKEEFNTAKTQ